MSSAAHPATSHPWGRSLRKRDPRSWSRYHQRPEPSLPDDAPRELSAVETAHLPVPVAIAGYEPDADRLRLEGRR